MSTVLSQEVAAGFTEEAPTLQLSHPGLSAPEASVMAISQAPVLLEVSVDSDIFM